MPKRHRSLSALGLNLRKIREAKALAQKRLGERPELDPTILGEIDRFLAQLDSEVLYDEGEGIARFESGGDCGRCTDSAVKVARQFNGLVVGYDAHENPSALLPGPYAQGHDFALIEGRFVVDYWASHWTRLIDQSVFDLCRPDDARVVRTLYGSVSRWEVVAGAIS